MKTKTYLVTGGSGFIGSALVRGLVSAGHHVRAFDNNFRGDTSRLRDIADEIEFMQGDIRDLPAVERAVAGVDGVCHLAFVNGTKFFYSKPELVLDVGVKGMVNVLDACVKHGIRELILASSSEVYQSAPQVPTDEKVPMSIPDPLNPRYSYGAGKIISEIMAINYGRTHFDRVLIFRPHNVFGPNMGWEHVIPEFIVRMSQLAKIHPSMLPFPIQGTGSETRSFIFIDDFIQALMLVIEKGEHLGIYNIGTTEELSILEVANRVGESLGRKIQLLPGKISQGSTLRRCPDISKISALGFKATHDLRSALARVSPWYLENVAQAPPDLRAPSTPSQSQFIRS